MHTDAFEQQVDTGATAPQVPSQRLLIFECGGRAFAVPAEEVREVVPFRTPTRLPGAPPHVSGIVNLRGTVVTVIDLARRLGLQERPTDTRGFVLLNKGGRAVGLTVDGVRDVVAMDESMLEPAGSVHAMPELTTSILRLESELVLMLDLQLLVRQVLLS